MRCAHGAGFLIVSVCLRAAGGPLNCEDVDAGVEWVLHADIEKLRAAEVGSLLLKRMETADGAKQLAALHELFNFDPRKDLDSVTAYGRASVKGENHGVLLVRGKFDTERLLALLRVSDEYEARQCGGRTVHGWIDAKARARAIARGEAPKKTYGCLFNEKLVVLGGSVEDVERAIGILERQQPSLRDSDLGKEFAALPADALLVCVARFRNTEQADVAATVLRAAKKISFWLSENEGFLRGSFTCATGTGEEADALKKIVEGMLTLTILNADKDPVAAGFARHVSVTIEGRKLTGQLSYPVEQLKADLEAAVGAQRAG